MSFEPELNQTILIPSNLFFLLGLGIEAGKEHSANMDDGQGLKRQIAVYREQPRLNCHCWDLEQS